MLSRQLSVKVSALVLLVALAGSSDVAADELRGHWVKGRILEAYHRVGGARFMGNATTPELDAYRGGKYQDFSKDSSIYWHPSVDNGVAHQVGGDIRTKWSNYGKERGMLGYPLTDEMTAPDGHGKYNHFENGSIYWTAGTGANIVQGRILDRWARDGWEQGELRYPITDELKTDRGFGRYNDFQNGSIYWTSGTGAQKVKGKIRQHWRYLGAENSKFAFPTSEEYPAPGPAVNQDFQGGTIQWIHATDRSLRAWVNTNVSAYRLGFDIALPEGQRWSEQTVAKEVMDNLSTYFPFQGCEGPVEVDKNCVLRTDEGIPAPVRVVGQYDHGFSFMSLPFHAEGAFRFINFRFVNPNGTVGDKTVRLVVEAWGPMYGASAFGPLNTAFIARPAWQEFGDNISQNLQNATITYICDENTLVRTKRSLPESGSLDGGGDVAVMPSYDLDISIDSGVVPMISLDSAEGQKLANELNLLVQETSEGYVVAEVPTQVIGRESDLANGSQ